MRITHHCHAGADLCAARSVDEQRRHRDPAIDRPFRRDEADGVDARGVQGPVGGRRLVPAGRRGSGLRLSPLVDRDPRGDGGRLSARLLRDGLCGDAGAVRRDRPVVRDHQDRDLFDDRPRRPRSRRPCEHHRSGRRRLYGRRAGRCMDFRLVHRHRRLAARLLAARRTLRGDGYLVDRHPPRRKRGGDRHRRYARRRRAGARCWRWRRCPRRSRCS